MPVPSVEAQRITRAYVPVRRDFLERSDSETPTPLEALMSRYGASGGGGAGGRLRVALLLSIMWVQAAEDFSSKRVPSWWASLLQLSDATNTGARAVRDTLTELERRNAIKLDLISPTVNRITLLDERGTGAAYSSPDGSSNNRYVRVPRALWAEGWISLMSGRALSVYLAVLAEYGWRDDPFWISGPAFRSKYGMSDSTRKKGLSDLVDIGVLSIIDTSAPDQTGTRNIRRNVYRLTETLQNSQP